MASSKGKQGHEYVKRVASVLAELNLLQLQMPIQHGYLMVSSLLSRLVRIVNGNGRKYFGARWYWPPLDSALDITHGKQ
jgi:hypothetical protein